MEVTDILVVIAWEFVLLLVVVAAFDLLRGPGGGAGPA